jgi:hypothetical protein
VNSNNQNAKWLVPNQGWHKVWNSCGRLGIGVVVREERGRVVAAMSKTRQGSFEPTTGEAIASFHAASVCKDLGIQHLILEGDA